MRFGWFVLTIVAMAGVGWMARIDTSSSSGAGYVYVTDRWMGTVRLCSVKGCIGLAFPQGDVSTFEE